MWRKSMILGVILAAVVFVVGYGRVLPYRLVLRSVLVGLGTILTIVAARKAITVFVQSGTGITASPQVQDINLGDLEGVKEAADQSTEGNQGEGVENLDVTEIADGTGDVEGDSDIEQLADMVSNTMKEDQEDELS